MKVIHLAPYDGIGGVENAMRTMPDDDDGPFRFKRVYLVDDPNDVCARDRALSSPRHLFGVVRGVARAKPDIVIASLWRAVLVALLIKLLSPRIRLVTFLHCPENVHWADRLVHALAIPLSSQVWADSDATRRGRLSGTSLARSRTISFKLRNVEPANPDGAPAPRFLFWGRLHAHKRIERAIEIFASVHERYPSASFRIIGPDGGELSKLRKLVETLKLRDAIEFVGPTSFAGLREEASRSEFYVQTSNLEGMAMSVMEAMQLGLLPVVTPVGAIADYCQAAVNCIIHNDDVASTVDQIAEALEKPPVYSALREGAIETWRSAPLYREDVRRACFALLKNAMNRGKRAAAR